MPYHYAIFSAQFAPHVGGVEAFTENLAKELVRQGNAATVITSRLDDSPEIELRDDGVTVFRLPSYVLMNGRLPISKKNARYTELLDKLEQLSPGRVLVNTRFYRHSLEGLRFAKKMSIPVVVLDHGSAHLVLGNRVADTVIEKYEHAITEKAKTFNPRFAGISQKSIEWLGHFGIPTSVAIPNSIDAGEFRSSSSGRDFRGELGLGANATVIVFVGRITPEKGPDKLFEAMQFISKDNVHAVFAGEGFLRQKLEAKNNSRMHFVGQLSREDLSALLSQSDLFCLPSRSEGFCTSLLEASAWGMQAVITNVGGAQEIIKDESCGRIIETAEPQIIAAAIEELIAMPAGERKAMGQSARRVVEEEFTWTNTVRALEAAFER